MVWLCMVTFGGVGGLATGQLATVHHWPVLLAVLAGGIVALPMGIIIGILTIRLGNLYVALVTLTFGLLMENLVFNRQTFLNNGLGETSTRRPSPPVPASSPTSVSSCSPSFRCSSSTCADRPPAWPSARCDGANRHPRPSA